MDLVGRYFTLGGNGAILGVHGVTVNGAILWVHGVTVNYYGSMVLQ